MLTTFLPVLLTARLIRRMVGALPASGILSRVTLTVAVHASPALVTDGFPASAMFRSLASAAGALTSAASTPTTMSLRMLPPSVVVNYTEVAVQVPQVAESGHRARTSTFVPRRRISTEAALFAYESSRSV